MMHTTSIDSQQLEMDYQAKFMMKVQRLVAKRAASCISQQVMAESIGRSLRTIQKFEHYRCMDAYLLYAYQQVLPQHNQ